MRSGCFSTRSIGTEALKKSKNVGNKCVILESSYITALLDSKLLGPRIR